MMNIEYEDCYTDTVLIELARKRYKSLIVTVHPDKTDDPRAHIATAMLNQAIAVLGNRTFEREYRRSNLRDMGQSFEHSAEDVATARKFIIERNTIDNVNVGKREFSSLPGTTKTDSHSAVNRSATNQNWPDNVPCTTEYSTRSGTSPLLEAKYLGFNGSKCSPESKKLIHATDCKEVGIAHSNNPDRIILVIDHRTIQGEVYFLVRIHGSDVVKYRKLTDILNDDHDKRLLSFYLINLEKTCSRRFLSLIRNERSLEDLYESITSCNG